MIKLNINGPCDGVLYDVLGTVVHVIISGSSVLHQWDNGPCENASSIGLYKAFGPAINKEEIEFNQKTNKKGV